MSTVISCPGKVLLAGGYLVLDPHHQGFVVSTPSRFYTVVQQVEAAGITPSTDEIEITVNSPQFDDGQWKYKAVREQGEEWKVREVKAEGQSSNPFIYLAIKSALLLSSALSPSTPYSSLRITIVGSNDFYSQSREDAAPIPFAPLNCKIKDVHKTGLGSSAAMVTSLVSALLLHLDSRTASTDSAASPTALSSSPPPPAKASFLSQHAHAHIDKDTLSLIHNLAQYVHSVAQGKVGSGFDVSAAVYGSHVYRRFAVECLNDVLDTNANIEPSGQQLLRALSPIYNPLWTKTSTAALVSPFGLPSGVTLMLADVDAGSNTPSMVGKVLAWRKANAERANALYSDLSASNADLAESFRALVRTEKEARDGYLTAVDSLAQQTQSEWSGSGSELWKLASSQIKNTRRLMREMGELSGVPIEPPEQTRLLDAVTALPGVIGAGVPGAGGYDAIWVLCLAPLPTSPTLAPTVEVEKVLRSWTEMSVRPLSRSAWVQGGAADIETGLLSETLEEVEGLKTAVERR